MPLLSRARSLADSTSCALMVVDAARAGTPVLALESATPRKPKSGSGPELWRSAPRTPKSGPDPAWRSAHENQSRGLTPHFGFGRKKRMAGAARVVVPCLRRRGTRGVRLPGSSMRPWPAATAHGTRHARDRSAAELARVGRGARHPDGDMDGHLVDGEVRGADRARAEPGPGRSGGRREGSGTTPARSVPTEGCSSVLRSRAPSMGAAFGSPGRCRSTAGSRSSSRC